MELAPREVIGALLVALLFVLEPNVIIDSHLPLENFVELDEWAARILSKRRAIRTIVSDAASSIAKYDSPTLPTLSNRLTHSPYPPA